MITKAVVNGVTTRFMENHYEVSGSTVTKYYYAGASRIAVRKDGTLNYILSDHLGSTSLVTDDHYDDNGSDVISEMRYTACPLRSTSGMLREGEVRYESGTTPTEYTYTGQFSYGADFGLMFFNARWYDPALGRFAQADTDVPESQGVQAFDRYAYVSNNPIRYNDPSGHMVVCGVADEGCGGGSGSGVLGDDDDKNDEGFNILDRYMLGWENFGQAWSTYWNPDLNWSTDWEIKIYSATYIAGWGGAHVWLAEGAAMLGCAAISGCAEAAETVLNAEVFIKGGSSWHLGLETPNNMNIIHIGNHIKYGIHIAIGAVEPYVADLHIYLQETFPFFRIFRR
jgi:RHS repeat-associated protein